MVKGLNNFKERFAPFTDKYVLIGGVACSLAMKQANLDFRATRDLDIVLQIDAIDDTFIKVFWKFIEAGGYENRQKSTGKEIFYRFFFS